MASEVASTGSTSMLGRSDFKLLRGHLLADPFDFAQVVGGFDLISDESHRPLSYLVSGCSDRLAALLCNPGLDSYVIRAIRKECKRLEIDYTTPDGIVKLGLASDQINIRIFRGAAKSTVITAASSLWRATNDPNETIAICSKSDEAAHAFSQQIADIIKGPQYKAFFPDRYPAGQEQTHLTKGAITLRGRTSHSPQTCIEARGYTSKSWVSTHYRVFYVDDIVGLENRSPQQLKGVYEWLTNMSGLDMPGRITRVHLGTIWDEEDDDALLSKNGEFFRLRVPIMEYEQIPENLFQDGTPTMPEWIDLEGIKRKRNATILNPEEGAISWRMNFLLDPTVAGGRIFPAAVVDQQWVEQVKQKRGDKEAFLMVRPKLDDEGKPVLHSETGLPETVTINPQRLQVVLGCDQAFSETGDEWGIAAYAEDHEGHGYVLDMRSGQGFDGFRGALLYMDEKWSPHKIALETNATQEISVTLLKEDKRFRRLRSKIIGVKHGSQSKEFRIRNNVAERMKMRKLWLRPNDQMWKAANEMKRYKPGRHASDNMLDAISMATVIVRKSQPDNKDYRRKMRQRELMRAERFDPLTGIPL